MRNGRSVGGGLVVILALALAAGLGCAKLGQPEFVGRWIGADSENTWDLFPDGAALIGIGADREAGTWSLLDDGRFVLDLSHGRQVVVGKMIVDGDRMVLVLEGGGALAWLRAGTPQALKIDYHRKAEAAMHDLKQIGKGFEMYAADKKRYPTLPDGSVAPLTDIFAPVYLHAVPVKDPWGNDYWVVGAADGASYAVVSFGADGKRDDAWARAETTDPNADIVFSNGQFLQSPNGFPR